jgi:dihydroorotase
VSARLGIAGIPSISESTMIARDAALAAYEGGRIHIQHLSAIESVEAVAAAKAAGTRITAEASPHHLLLTDADVLELDTRRKMNPPLRAERDRQAVVDALRDGVIDCVATDHAPHHRDDKDVPFERAAFGTTGLETAFSSLYTGLVLPGVLDLARLVTAMSEGAAVLDLPVPRIAVGETANCCLVDLRAGWLVGEAGYESRSENSAFAGQRMTGRVLLTLADGIVAYRERAFALTAA